MKWQTSTGLVRDTCIHTPRCQSLIRFSEKNRRDEIESNRRKEARQLMQDKDVSDAELEGRSEERRVGKECPV